MGHVRDMAEQAAGRSGRFPLWVLIVAVTGVAVGASVLVMLVTSWLGGGSETEKAVWYAGAATWAAVVVSSLPVKLVEKQGVTAMTAAYFAGMGLRLLLCLVFGWAGVKGMRLPMTPLLLGMAAIYLPTLLVEAGFVGWSLSQKDAGRVATVSAGREV